MKKKSLIVLVLLILVAVMAAYYFNGITDLLDRTRQFFYPSFILETEIVGEGSIQPEPGQHEYDEGDTLLVIAEPDEGWRFSHWEGDVSGEEPQLEITMDEDKVVRAVFEQEEYSLTVEYDEEGGEVLVDPDLDFTIMAMK